MLINPEPKLDNGSLTVREDDTIGPYNCSTDCNPPCKIKWRYKDTADEVYDASSNGHELSIQKVNRDMSDSDVLQFMNKTKGKNITLF